MKENDMKEIVKQYFYTRGFMGFEEVPIQRKRIDLYFVHQNYPKTIAVELKIQKWKDALRQAYQNRFYAQMSYVGLWHEHLTDLAVSKILNFGLGVLAIKSDSVILIAKPSNRCLGILPSTMKILDSLTANNNAFLWRELE